MPMTIVNRRCLLNANRVVFLDQRDNRFNAVDLFQSFDDRASKNRSCSAATSNAARPATLSYISL